MEAEAGPWLATRSEPADLALCIGSTHAFGGLPGALDAILGAVRPGGCLLVGDLFWQREPHPDYEAIFGAEHGIVSHADNVENTSRKGRPAEKPRKIIPITRGRL